MKGRIGFLINLHSGKKMQVEFLERARRTFVGYRCEFVFLSDLSDWENVALWQKDPEIKALVVVGGDGTANASLPYILGFQKPVAYLPGGTANDFARACGFENLDLQALKQAIESESTVRVDVLEVNGRPFLTAGGVGLPMQVSKHINHQRNASAAFRLAFRALRSQMYGFVALKKILHLQPTEQLPLHLTVSKKNSKEGSPNEESQKEENLRAPMVFFCNLGTIGKHLKLSPGSLWDDGQCEVLEVGENKSRWQVLHSLAHARFGHGLKNMRCWRGEEFSLKRTDGQDMAFFADGEVLALASRFDIRLRPKALTVFAHRLAAGRASGLK
jgi:diacylglycerol kinase (ATP)